jgi:squalene-hopene/tetraprenyl-beta-curcumene cyclase
MRMWIGIVIGLTALAPLAMSAGVGKPWSPQSAAAYLDGRADWWMTWKPAARDQGTFCISCHTTMPYALARPALDAEAGAGGADARVVAGIEKRVRNWKELAGKTPAAQGSAAVLNALVLASVDAGAGRLSDVTLEAFANLWALQLTDGPEKGAWKWYDFHEQPWEADDSPYWGAALAAVAVGRAPEGYASRPENRERVKMLVEYLRASAAKQSLFNRVALLWAAAKLPGLMTSEERAAAIRDVFGRQRADGGWRSATLVVDGWKRMDGTPLDAQSDGYATGFATYAMEQAGVRSSDARLGNALAWLRKHQDTASGSWPAMSLNKQRDPASDIGKFMRDAATGYAVLALIGAK